MRVFSNALNLFCEALLNLVLLRICTHAFLAHMLLTQSENGRIQFAWPQRGI
jgi:hypothetical protein